jgi:hypothetical protein
MGNLNEEFKTLRELIRKVGNTLLPYGGEDKLAYLQKKDVRDRLQGKFPKCFLAIKGKGQDIPFLPICNRMGVFDPDIMKFSIKLANKMNGQENIDQDDLTIILAKLEKLHKRYTQDPVKPPIEAAKKGLTTRLFNNIKNHLDKQRA